MQAVHASRLGSRAHFRSLLQPARPRYALLMMWMGFNGAGLVPQSLVMAAARRVRVTCAPCCACAAAAVQSLAAAPDRSVAWGQL